ncbi:MULTISPECIES: DNA-processing protein DprA [Caldimonas]|jgi:DNA processing protein|uniref:DNA-processing protein DprA n=1 Tax=Caldimonas TaxID=196013 RepID=UPI00035FBD8E|nr:MULTISPECIES: DNA-processing protein DprA [Caldimonas]GIX23895.1 MAG: DNA processing protein DprA [Caldimonas sp.]
MAASSSLSADELAAWLRLLETPGLGRQAVRRLLAAFGSPQAACAAAPQARRHLLSAPAAQALEHEPPQLAGLVARTLEWLQADARHHVLTLGDPAYPPWLLATADPPVLLYACGDLAWLQAPCLAIVGTRHPTRQGQENARAFAHHLSQAGWTIVSGLALGIDAAAHEGGLSGPGRTIAVVGTGLDQVYPRRHRALAERIAAEGLLLSEYPLGTPPLPQHFPQRNRLIAGLSRGTLVVEAALQSGSLITARLAAEQGREVFAIPGSIHAPQSRGCHALIKQGAKLVESAQDILEDLLGPEVRPPTEAAPSACSPDETEDPLLMALGHDPASLDALQARCGWPTDQLNARLLELELEGRVERLPGGLYQRCHRA